MEMYLKYKAELGCWHELTLHALEMVVLIRFKLGGDHHHHHAQILMLKQTIIAEVLEQCTESVDVYKAAVHIAKNLLRVKVQAWAEKAGVQVAPSSCAAWPGLPCEHDFDIGWTHPYGDDYKKISLVFIVGCLHRLGHYEKRTYSEVMAAVLLEMQLYRQFVYQTGTETVELIVLLQAGARLHCFWQELGRIELCSTNLGKMLAHFRASSIGNCLVDEVSDEVVLVLLATLISHADGEKRIDDIGKVICHAINHKVKELLDEVLCALRESKIDPLSLRFKDIRGLVHALGAQSNYVELESLLLQLWRSRQVQRNWEPETVLSIGHALVHAHVAAEHLEAVIALCDTLRHSGDGLDDEAVEASQLLSRLYPRAGRHDRAMGIYEEVLREVDKDGPSELFDRWAGQQLRMLRCSYGSNGGFANNSAT